MADNDLEVFMNARTVLIEQRLKWATSIAAGYKPGETEAAIKGLLEVQQAIDVIDDATMEIEELAELEELTEDDEA